MLLTSIICDKDERCLDLSKDCYLIDEVVIHHESWLDMCMLLVVVCVGSIQ